MSIWMLFSPPWRATQRVVALGDRGGDGEGLEGQRSTTAKRHIYWPKCWLHSLTSGPLQALGPDLSWLHLPRAASSSQGSQRGQLTGRAWSCTVRTGSTAGRRLIRHLDSWERRSSAFVAAPPLSKYSKLFTPRRPFLSSSTLFMPSHFFHGAGEGGSLREPLSKQWRKEAAIFTLFPGEPAFLFFYLSSKLSN